MRSVDFKQNGKEQSVRKRKERLLLNVELHTLKIYTNER